MRITLVPRKDTNARVFVDTTWEAFQQELLTHERRAEKDGTLWCAVNWVDEEQSRTDDNVESLSLAVFDLDHTNADEVDAIQARLKEANLSHSIYSTYRHTPEEIRLRLVLYPSRPVLKAEWPAFWTTLVDVLGLPADPSCRSLSRIYYTPSCPPDAEPVAICEPGEPVNVDEVLAHAESLSSATPSPSKSRPTDSEQPSPRSDEPAPPHPTNREELIAVLRTIRKPASRELVERIIDQQPLAEVGARDTTLQRAVSIIAGKVPVSTPDELIIEFIRPSLEKTPSTPGDELTVEDAMSKLGRAKERKEQWEAERKVENAAKKESDDKLRAVLQRAALKVSSRDLLGREPWTDDEWSQIAAKHGCTVEEIKHRLIVQRGRSFYVLGPDGIYLSPLTLDDIAPSLKRDLSRADFVDFFARTASGAWKEKTLKQLIEEYGVVARSVTASMALQCSYYDASTQTFFEAVCPLRKDIQPCFHPEVDDWLRRLFGGGEGVEKEVEGKGMDWLATLTDVSKPTAALYLSGAPRTGKSFLMSCCARLWGSSYADLKDVMSNFNDALTRCPVVGADEEIVPTFGRELSTHQLRQLIASSERTLARKFLPTASLNGCIRLILASNNDRLLETRENHSADDMAAISERFLHIDVGGEAATYLAQIGGRSTTDKWVKDCWVEEHLLWLRDNRKVTPSKRLIVEGLQTSFHTALAVNNSASSTVCEWIVKYILDPKPLADLKISQGLKIGDGKILIATKLLADKDVLGRYANVSNYISSPKVIGMALRNLSNEESRRIGPKNGDRFRCYSINIDYLIAWAEKTGMCFKEDILDAVNVVTK